MRWFEYLWEHLEERRLTPQEWKALEGLVREEASKRFKNTRPTAFQMLLAACDVREASPSMDSLVSRVRGLARGRGRDPSGPAAAAPTVALRSQGRRREV